MPSPSGCHFLSAHHLLFQVLALVERAKSHVVLATAYFDPWPDLELVLRQAIARGVAVHLITRTADAKHCDPSKRKSSLDQVSRLGVKVHEVPWLHAKMYFNEAESIVTSFNLIGGGHKSLNVGIHMQGADAVGQSLAVVKQWIPGFVARADLAPAASAVTDKPKAFCIRCGGARSFFNPSKPYCHDCWQAHGTDEMQRNGSACHRCGDAATTSLHQPLCEPCNHAAN
jgi:hypothetical protein